MVEVEVLLLSFTGRHFLVCCNAQESDSSKTDRKGPAPGARLAIAYARRRPQLPLAQKVRQLGDVHGDAPSLIAG